GQKSGELRHKAGDHQNDGCQSQHAPVDDFGGGDDTYVLAVSGCGKSSEERAQDVADSVHDNAALEFLVLRHAVHTSGCGGGEISDGLDGVDGKEKTDSHTGRGLKVHGKMHGLGKLEPSGGLY